MKAIYIIMLIVGAVLLLATEGETIIYNLCGLAMFTLSAYKLNLFENNNSKHDIV